LEAGVVALETKGHKGPVTEQEAKSAVAQLAEEAKTLNLNGGDRKSENYENQIDIVKPIHQGGNDSEYLTARIKRDHPEILDRMKRGEFKSVRSAAIEAGIIVPPSVLQILQRTWNRATESERREFMEWVLTTSHTTVILNRFANARKEETHQLTRVSRNTAPNYLFSLISLYLLHSQ
jgi:hypothetical protein